MIAFKSIISQFVSKLDQNANFTFSYCCTGLGARYCTKECLVLNRALCTFMGRPVLNFLSEKIRPEMQCLVIFVRSIDKCYH